tara:strand:- start:156 stop:371 length:216 start_codon:yes stop_codon:yes gene_type:complete
MIVKLSDNSIAQIVRLIQMGMLTGTDIVDQLRTLQLVADGDKLEPSDAFLETFEANIQKMQEMLPEEPTDQ